MGCFGNPDPVDMKVCSPCGEEAFGDEEPTKAAQAGGDHRQTARCSRLTSLVQACGSGHVLHSAGKRLVATDPQKASTANSVTSFWPRRSSTELAPPTPSRPNGETITPPATRDRTARWLPAPGRVCRRVCCFRLAHGLDSVRTRGSRWPALVRHPHLARLRKRKPGKFTQCTLYSNAKRPLKFSLVFIPSPPAFYNFMIGKTHSDTTQRNRFAAC
jgi:hypothetical protein